MEKWLNCKISQGQFTGEFAVQGVMSNSKGFSLFVPENSVRVEKKPKGDENVDGIMRVMELDREGDRVLVKLPQPAFENGQTITVKANQIK